MKEIVRTLYLKKIRPFYNKDLIKVICGIRRSGKSVLMSQIQDEFLKDGIQKDNMFIVNMENQRDKAFLDPDKLHTEVMEFARNREGKIYIFIDEVHHIKDWAAVLNSLRVNLDCDIYVTGSNSKLINTGLSAQVNGRYIVFTVYPFSFAEFKELYLKTNENGSTDDRSLFLEYIQFGGMPFLGALSYDQNPSIMYLSAMLDEIIMRDIILTNQIRNSDLLERLFTYILQTPGNQFSSSSIAKYLKTERRKSADSETITSYIRYGEEAFVFYPVDQYGISGKEILKRREKIYIADHGLRLGQGIDNMEDIQLILENIVCLEGLRRGYQVYVGSSKGKEVDFVLKNQKKTVYIQVTYLMPDRDTYEREFSVLEKIDDGWPKYVVSMDPLKRSRNGIGHEHIADFLLMDW